MGNKIHENERKQRAQETQQKIVLV